MAWVLSGFGDEIDQDPNVQVAVLQALGARQIEVRSAWGINIVELSREELEKLKAMLHASGMGVSAIASPVGKVSVDLPVEHELARLDAAITAATILGSRYIRVFSFYYEGDAPAARDAVIGRMRALVGRAEKAGVVLLHENEKDIFGDVPERILDIIESVQSPALRVAWDPANFVQVGVRPFSEAFVRLRPHIEYVHVKDALFTDGSVVPAGEGDGELAETVEALRDSGYSGFVSLEPHLAEVFASGGFSGPAAFGVAARAFAKVLSAAGMESE